METKRGTSDSIRNLNVMFNKNILEKVNKDKVDQSLNLNNEIIKLNDFELNHLEYNRALNLDKRSYIQYYFSLLKMKHLILFTFYTKNDYNSRIIKIILFLFSFALYLTINALFFNDKTMHKIYEDQGNFNFVYQIPQIIYSTIISSLINMIIKYLSLSEKNIIKIKNENNKTNKNISELLKCLIIKFIIFFILIYIFLIFFWYYLSCFCAVYHNTQYHLLKDTLISFGLSLIYPFIINLLPGLLRIPSLKKKNRENIYKISKIIQLV